MTAKSPDHIVNSSDGRYHTYLAQIRIHELGALRSETDIHVYLLHRGNFLYRLTQINQNGETFVLQNAAMFFCGYMFSADHKTVILLGTYREYECNGCRKQCLVTKMKSAISKFIIN